MSFGPDDAAASLQVMLMPNGTPVGTLRLVVTNSPEVPYSGVTPVLFIYPEEDEDTYIAARATMDQGWLVLTYLDSTPTIQGTVLATVEKAMWANRKAIRDTIRSDLTWKGTMTAGGFRIQGHYNPDGPIKDEMGGYWVVFRLRVTWRGPKEFV